MALAGSFYENRLNPLILSGRFQNIPYRDKIFHFDIYIYLCYVFQRNYIYSKTDYKIIPKQNNFLQKIPMRISIMVLSRRTKKGKRGLYFFIRRNRIEGAPAEAGAPSLMAN